MTLETKVKLVYRYYERYHPKTGIKPFEYLKEMINAVNEIETGNKNYS